MSDPPVPRKYALLAATVLVMASAAAIVLPDAASGRSFETVGTLGEGADAYAVDLDDGDRVRFQLQDEAGEATPTARFALYDPHDGYFGSFGLEGLGDHVDVLADRPGDWVVFVVSARNANLAVQLESSSADDASSGDPVERLDVKEVTRPVVEQDGGPLDARLAVRMDHRPAVAFLRAEGTMQDLTAQLVSEEGLAYAIEGMHVNETVRDRGERTVQLAALAEGTYRIAAEAASFNGTLSLVEQTYERPAPTPPEPIEAGSNTTDANATDDGNATDDANGNASADADASSVVAQLHEGEPALVAPQGADEMTLRVGEHGRAVAYVYDGSDDLVQTVELGSSSYDRDRHEHDGNGSSENASDDAAWSTTVSFASDDAHVVYVEDLQGSEALEVVLDVADAEDAAVLDKNVTTVEVTDEDGSANTTLEGGLLHVDARSHSAMEGQREVNVTGPMGVVYASSTGFSTFGVSLGWDREVHPSNFADGLFTVRTDGDSWFGDGAVEVELVSYVR